MKKGLVAFFLAATICLQFSNPAQVSIAAPSDSCPLTQETEEACPTERTGGSAQDLAADRLNGHAFSEPDFETVAVLIPSAQNLRSVDSARIDRPPRSPIFV